MKGWHRLDPRHDAIRKWAELEGKSPTMSDDLARGRRAQEPDKPARRLAGVARLVRLVSGVAEAWRRITRR